MQHTQMEEDTESASFLDGLISRDTRRRTREQTQPLIDILCSPACIRSTILTVGSALLLLTILLIAISLSQSDERFEEGNTKDMDGNAPAWMLDQVTDKLIRTHLQSISSDLMEGRGTGTRGEDLATQYIVSHFVAAGLEPAIISPTTNSSASSSPPPSSFFQPVPLASVTPISSSIGSLSLGSLSLTYPDQYTSSTDLLTSSLISVYNAEIIFVGYGIIAPSFQWDDYKDTNVTGKVLLMLVNEPYDSTHYDLFAGDTLTYYGRWTYKYEQARAKGAMAVILVHTDNTAGYGWQVVANSFAGEQVMLSDPPVKNPLHFKGWINENAANSLASLHGASLADWLSAANDRSFTPFLLNSRMTHSMTYTVRYFTGTNVIARLGPPPDAHHTEAVVMMAHHDHLGIRPSSSSSTDTIYNGAVDNASGVAALLAAAHALGSLYRSQYVVAPGLTPDLPKKAILFLSLTGEESNLLGASYFTSHSPCSIPLCGVKSALNFDVMNVWGKTKNTVVIGHGMSKYMDELATKATDAEQLTLVPDPTPQLGHLFRSDQLPFALKHIPSITLSTGTDFVGQPSGYYVNVTEDYVANHYHQPSDEYDEKWSMEGIKQQVRIMLRMAYWLAAKPGGPKMDNSDILPPPTE